MNKLLVGFSKQIDPPWGSYLLIADEVSNKNNARMFDPLKDRFDPLERMDYKKAAQFVAALQALLPAARIR
jgi:hypothetical protein